MIEKCNRILRQSYTVYKRTRHWRTIPTKVRSTSWYVVDVDQIFIYFSRSYIQSIVYGRCSPGHHRVRRKYPSTGIVIVIARNVRSGSSSPRSSAFRLCENSCPPIDQRIRRLDAPHRPQIGLLRHRISKKKKKNEARHDHIDAICLAFIADDIIQIHA